MWICPKCRTELDGSFAACWQCGTDAYGAEDPGFVREEPAHFCHVCAAPGAWEAADGVYVCPGCLAGTTPDLVRRPWYRRSRVFVGRVAGHPIHVEPFLVLVVFVAVLPAGGWRIFAATMLALLVHAFGHAVAARLAGLGTESVTIALAGVYDPPDALEQFAGSRDHRQRGAAVLVTVAGPLGNLLVAGVSWAVARLVPGAALDAIASVNLLFGLGSLLPVPPFDGGRLFIHALARSHEASPGGHPNFPHLWLELPRFRGHLTC